MHGGEVIARARRRAGLTQQELAARVGTTTSVLSRWERGHVDPAYATVDRLVEACGATVRAVLGEPDVHAADVDLLAVTLALSPDERLHRVVDLAGAERAAPSFRPDRILAVLAGHGVRFAVIGGVAATVHGAPAVTADLDVVPDPAPANLRRLSGALGELEARVRVPGITGGLAIDHDPRVLAAIGSLDLVTRHGALDIVRRPTGVPDYADWAAGASEIELLGTRVAVAGLADVIRSKEAADRPDDRAALPVLRLVAQLQRQPQRHRRPHLGRPLRRQ